MPGRDYSLIPTARKKHILRGNGTSVFLGEASKYDMLCFPIWRRPHHHFTRGYIHVWLFFFNFVVWAQFVGALSPVFQKKRQKIPRMWQWSLNCRIVFREFWQRFGTPWICRGALRSVSNFEPRSVFPENASVLGCRWWPSLPSKPSEIIHSVRCHLGRYLQTVLRHKSWQIQRNGAFWRQKKNRKIYYNFLRFCSFQMVGMMKVELTTFWPPVKRDYVQKWLKTAIFRKFSVNSAWKGSWENV